MSPIVEDRIAQAEVGDGGILVGLPQGEGRSQRLDGPWSSETAKTACVVGASPRYGSDRTVSAIVNHMVNDPFKALSHPIRRGIVERLADGPATVGDATAGFGVSKPAISKHLKVLEETGVVRREVEGRTHRLSLELDALSDAAEWMDRQRALWERMFDVVDEYLNEEETK